MSKYITRRFTIEIKRVKVYNKIDKIEEEILENSHHPLPDHLIKIDELDKHTEIELRRMPLKDFYLHSEKVE